MKGVAVSTPFCFAINFKLVLIHGYVRVSASGPTQEEQFDALNFCDLIHQEATSKRGTEVLRKVIDQLQAGDTLAVTRLDRLGRPAAELIHLVQLLHMRGVGLQVLSDDIDTATEQRTTFMRVCASLRKLDQDLTRELEQHGSGKTKTLGAKLGRPRTLTPQKLEKALALLNAGMSHGNVAQNLGVSRSALYRAFPPSDPPRQKGLF